MIGLMMTQQVSHVMPYWTIIKMSTCGHMPSGKVFIIQMSVADPGVSRGPPPTPVKTSQKKMATMGDRKFRESSPPPGQISGSATECCANFTQMHSRIITVIIKL